MSAFEFAARVYWEDTDGGGVVYHANYLRFLERARTEWLRSLGFSQSILAKDPGIIFPVIHVAISYRRPARLDDELFVSCRAERDTSATLRFVQRIEKRSAQGAPETLIEAEVRAACVDAVTFRPKRLPAALTDAMLAHLALELK